MQEILRYISLLLAMQPAPLERPDFAEDTGPAAGQVCQALLIWLNTCPSLYLACQLVKGRLSRFEGLFTTKSTQQAVLWN